MKIGLLSDTHGFLDPRIKVHFSDCDEIWHAGDIGDEKISHQLSAFKKFRAVCGNIDGSAVRLLHPEEIFFQCEGVAVLITHIGGYPGNYSMRAKEKIRELKPDLFICGHSHILKVMPDRENNLLHMNPGAAGTHGFHKYRTILRFAIRKGKITDVEAIELGLRGEILTEPVG